MRRFSLNSNVVLFPLAVRRNVFQIVYSIQATWPWREQGRQKSNVWFFPWYSDTKRGKKKKKEKLKKYTSLVFYHQFILSTTKVKTSNIKLLLYIQTYLLSVYLQVLFNCVRKISLIVGRRKVGMVIHFSVGEDPVLSGLKKHTCFYPCLANWIKYHLKLVYVEVVKRRKCYIYNRRFLCCLFWRFCFPFL